MPKPVRLISGAAILALLLAGPGASDVRARLPGALLSTVNLAEVITKLCERGMPADLALTAVQTLGVELVDFGAAQACATGGLRGGSTRSAGLSLGDRACLALARERHFPAITTDTAWANPPDFDVRLIRSAP